MRRLLVLFTAVAALSACAHHTGRDHLAQRHLYPGARFGQVAAFDGHELWVDYACGGERVQVRYLGAWADAVTQDGTLHRLNRIHRHSGRGHVDYEADGYRLSGHGLRPAWTVPGAQPVGCRGSA